MNPLIRLSVTIGAVFVWVIGFYHVTAAEVFSIWWRSDTIAHGLLVIPMFAWLAWRTVAGLPGNLPSVTGAREASVLGAIFPANPRHNQS